MTSAKNPKTYLTYDVTHKKTGIQNFPIYFQCKQEDLPHCLRVLKALYLNHLASYGVAKWCENTESMWAFKVQFHIPAPKVLKLGIRKMYEIN